jgi:2-phosphosulfolactate phosphatase
MMDIDLVTTWEEARHVDMNGRVAIIIDVLRASSTIVAALASGAEKVTTVDTVENAMALADNIGRDHAVLGGERGSVRLPGFDLGNSPLEYTASAVSGRHVIMTTTNGTQAVEAASNAEEILIGAIVNADAVADRLRERGLPMTIVCAGTEGRLSLDDLHCGGLIISRLMEPGYVPQLSDGVRVALQWYAANAGNVDHVLNNCVHGKRLLDKGMADDVAWCASVDSVPLVPVLKGNGFVRT